ncbi:MAG: hypothetical protein SFV15_13100 [Polyangiaceae bacterium]|nr:hypothetical protein [Polyangiaceae bacterium]
MKNLFRNSLIVSAFLGATAISTLASAQTPAPAPAPGASDHDSVVGHLGVGYLGRRGMLIGTLGNEVQAPVIGVRYWMDSQMGIDAGLGFSSTSGSTEVSGGGVSVKADSPSNTAFILHGGVPIVLSNGKHYSFQITPELNLGIGSGSSEQVQGGVALKTDTSGFHLDLGARAGGEVHFGFMGLPEVSLLANVGLALAHDSVSTEGPQGVMNGVPGPTVKNSASQLGIGTTVGNSPWSIFTSSVAALYYF